MRHQDLGGAQAGERHGPRRLGALLRAGGESVVGAFPHPGQRGARRGGAQPPQAAAPPVAEPRLVLPPPVHGHPVVEAPVRTLRVRGEREIPLGQPGPFRGAGSGRDPVPVVLTGQHDQAPGNVVEAVTVFAARRGVLRVFEQAGVVAEPAQVGEGGREQGGRVGCRRAGHRAALSLVRAPSSVLARAR